MCFSAKSLKKPPPAKQHGSQPGQARLWEVGGERRRTTRSGAACVALRQQDLQALSEERLSPERNWNQGTFSIQTIHRLLYLEYFYIAGGLDIFSSEMGSRRGSGTALPPPNLEDAS